MSKVTFSETMNEVLFRKLCDFLNRDPNKFFEYDEYFELALCISYLTLTKEKIIFKDKENNDRLGRLERKVDLSEIDKVFEPSFCSRVPNIIFAKEYDNTWILDNIRDCIMHGIFEVDETKRCFILDNNQTNRELKAEIPFEWFIAYMKHDILSKKLANRFVFNGFFYNKDRNTRFIYQTKNEVFRNIMYKVDIKGNQFNVDEVSNKIRDFMLRGACIEEPKIPEEDFEKDISHKRSYSVNYLNSFKTACYYTLEEMRKEYPDLDISIRIDDKKHKFANTVGKHLAKYYYDYDVLIEELEHGLNRKSYELVSYIKKLLMNLDGSCADYVNGPTDSASYNSYIRFADSFDGLYGIDLLRIDNVNRFNIVSNYIINVLVNIYGITTLVMNSDNLYSNEFNGVKPSNLGIYTTVKGKLIEYENHERELLEHKLDTEITLYKLRKKNELTPSKQTSKRIIFFEEKLKSIEARMGNCNFRVIYSNQYFKDGEKIEYSLRKYYEHFKNADDEEAKKRIKDCILKLYDKKVENETEYASVLSDDDMHDTLEIIRNCFSHIGRIYVNENRGLDTLITMVDYDSDNVQSGCVVIKLRTLIELLKKPFNFSETLDSNVLVL